MIQRHSKWHIAIAISIILSSSALAEKQGRRLVDSKKAVNSIRKHAESLKTDEEVGEGKTIDYTLYNYGGSAVLSLKKDAATNLNFNDTQASTIAALGNAALILGGALLFGQLNNRIQAKAQHNLYSRGFKPQLHPLPPPVPSVPLRKRRLRNKFRKRRLRPAVYSQRTGRYPVGGRRRLRKNFRTRQRLQRVNNNYQNHRIQEYYPQTRDQVSVPLREETYSSEASVLDPIKPMLYDPYNYEDPAMMEDYYYDDYYDAALPDFSQVPRDQGNQIQTKSQPSLIKPVEPMKTPDLFMPESRTPSRNEMLLKMSEEKRQEKLQKERAKLLQATLMKPEEMSEPEIQTPFTVPPQLINDMDNDVRTRARIPLRQMRQRQPIQQELKSEMPSFENSFENPRTAFQTTFNRPQQPQQPQRSPSQDVSTDPVEDPFTFRQDVDPFQEMSESFRNQRFPRRRINKPRLRRRFRFRDLDYY